MARCHRRRYWHSRWHWNWNCDTYYWHNVCFAVIDNVMRSLARYRFRLQALPRGCGFDIQRKDLLVFPKAMRTTSLCCIDSPRKGCVRSGLIASLCRWQFAWGGAYAKEDRCTTLSIRQWRLGFVCNFSTSSCCLHGQQWFLTRTQKVNRRSHASVWYVNCDSFHEWMHMLSYTKALHLKPLSWYYTRIDTCE